MAKNTNFENYTADTQKAFTEQSAQMVARLGEAAEFAKGNADAVFASANKAAASMKDIATEMLGYAQASMDANIAALKDLSNAKDASEFMERQSTHAKSSMESFAKQAQKINEMTVAAAKDCSEPVSARVAAVGEMVKTGGYKA